MAVSKVRKVFVFTLKSVAGDVLAQIQGFASMHLEDAEEVIEELRREENTAPGADIARKLSAVEGVISALGPYERPLTLMERLSRERPRYAFEHLERLAEQEALESVVGEVGEITERRGVLAREAEGLRSQAGSLLPWAGMEERLDTALHPTAETTGLFLEIAAESVEKLDEMGQDAAFELVSQRGDNAYVIVVAWTDAVEELKQGFSELDAQVIALPDVERTPAGESARIEERLGEIEQERQGIEEKLAALATKLDPLRAYRDYLAILGQRAEATQLLSDTEQVTVLVGYVPLDRQEDLEKRLAPFGTAVQAVFEEPTEDENTPVLLVNGKVVRSFEVVTNIYGLPSSRDLDPTPLLTPFFALFFAVALTDAGYGAFLALTTLCVMRFLKVSPVVKRFMRMMFVAGCMTIVLGILTGGYFGIQAEKLPKLLQRAIIVDPMADPVKFLGVALGLGFIQLWFGMFVSFYNHWRTDGPRASICLDLPWILLMPGAVIAYYGDGLGDFAQYFLVALAGAMILLLNGYEHKNVLKRLGVGAYALYGVTGLLGDFLSYSRLMAFGLATAGIGMVVNQLSGMVAKVPVIGWLLMVLLLVFGHLFNLLINAFGGWIHTARLQFIEFFGRFYEGGGRPFVPLAPQTRYVDVDV